MYSGSSANLKLETNHLFRYNFSENLQKYNNIFQYPTDYALIENEISHSELDGKIKSYFPLYCFYKRTTSSLTLKYANFPSEL